MLSPNLCVYLTTLDPTFGKKVVSSAYVDAMRTLLKQDQTWSGYANWASEKGALEALIPH